MKDLTKTSKLLAYVLRHRPDELDLELDEAGWTDAGVLLDRLRERRGIPLQMADLERLVAEDHKGRYSLRDGRIRANQGHTVDAVDAIDRTPRVPPAVLWHGTTDQRWQRIQQSGGLRPMQRHHVHLSAERSTAREVGARHRSERPVVLRVDAERMHRDGHVFLVSENGVWLADAVPCGYLTLDEPDAPGTSAPGSTAGPRP